MAIISGMAALACTLAVALPGPAGEDWCGDWRIAEAARVEWSEPPALQPVSDDALLGKTVGFDANAVHGPSPLGCAGATYERTKVMPQGLFQGLAAEMPEKAEWLAQALNLAPDDAPTWRVACDTGAFDYHLSRDAKLMLMLDQVIYTLEPNRP